MMQRHRLAERHFAESCDHPACLALVVNAGDPEPPEEMSPREIVRHLLEVVEPMPNHRMRAASVRRYRRDLAARHRGWYIERGLLPVSADDAGFRGRRAMRRSEDSAEQLRRSTGRFDDTMRRLFGEEWEG